MKHGSPFSRLPIRSFLASRLIRARLVRTLIVLALLSSTSAMLTGTSYARPEPPPQSNDQAGPSSVSAPGTLGVEWITDWPGTADDRANWYYSANGLYNELVGNGGWSPTFRYGETNAWERDFKAAVSGGNGLVDSVDIAMIGTHGTSAYDSKWGKNLSAVYFSSNNDDWTLSPGEAYRAYGGNNLEWLAFDSCSVLRDDSRAYWHETFNGLHLMLGFANTMYVVYPGDGGAWGDQMLKKGWWIFGHGAKTVTQAWFSAVEDQQPSGVRARVLAEELNNYNDYLWGQGYVSPDYPNNGGYWYWDHVAGTPKPLQITTAPTSANVYRVVPRTVNPAYVQAIGSAFGLSGQVLTAPDGSAFYMTGGISDTKQLRVDAHSGGYLFQDLNELWTNPEMPRTLPPSGPRAESLATSFLTNHANVLPGMRSFSLAVTPTIEMEGPTVGAPAGAAVPGATAVISPTDYAVHYGRTLDIGGGQLVSVVGPGSRLNVYLGNNDQVIGAKGGWRDVEIPPAVQSTQAVTVPIKTADQAWAQFLANPNIALAKPPLATVYNRTGKPEPTLAYYEQTLSISQTELIPAWVFVADLYTSTLASRVQTPSAPAADALVASDVSIYVPASAAPAAAPQATILSPAANATILPGHSIVLSGTVTGGTPPYTFQWSSSVDGSLGAGSMVTVPGLSPDLRGTSLHPNEITLLVTDANGQQSTATVNVRVPMQVFLPIVIK